MRPQVLNWNCTALYIQRFEEVRLCSSFESEWCSRKYFARSDSGNTGLNREILRANRTSFVKRQKPVSNIVEMTINTSIRLKLVNVLSYRWV